jgi:uncharacterized protein YdhG (YjbR/CyaY superfamily)
MTRETKAGGTGKRAAPMSFRGYLAEQPREARAALLKLIETVRALVPDAEEGISYGMPVLYLRGSAIAGFAVRKGFCSYYPMSGSVVAACKADLAGFVTSKGAIQFTLEKQIPASVVKKLVKTRLKELDGEG